MAEKLCELKKKGGGGKYTETSLWTNPSPSSSFAGQQITLSDDVDNYKYIGIKWAYSSSYTSSEYCEVAIYPVSDLKKAVISSSVRKAIPAIASGMSNVYHRVFYYISNTKLQFIDCYQSGTSTATNAQTIPLEILGLNELDHGKRFDETTLWTNNAPTNSFDAQSVTLSSDMDNYDYLMVRFRNSTSNATEDEVLISPANLKKSLASLGTNRVEVAIGSAGSYAAYRRVTYIDDTTINFTKALQISGTSSNTTMAIPTSIIGCKFK